MQPFILGAWRVDPQARTLTHRQDKTAARVRVSNKANDVLLALVAAAGAVVTRERLMDLVWPDVVVGEEVLTHAIAELRRALGDTPRAPTYIETVHKSGYRLLCEAEVAAQAPIALSTPDAILTPFTTDESSSGAFVPEAYMRYLQGRSLFESGGRVKIQGAIDCFEEALALDRGSPLAHAGLANAIVFKHWFYHRAPDQLERAVDLARAAIAFDPRLADGHTALALALAANGARDAALQSFGRSVTHGRDAFEPHLHFGRFCFTDGQYELAVALLERAAQLRPADFQSLNLAAKAYRGLGDWAAAERSCRRSLIRAEAYLVENPDDTRALCTKAVCLTQLGQVERAYEIATTRCDSSDPLTYQLAGAFARAKEAGPALQWLESVVDNGWGHPFWLMADPDLAGLHRERRYKRLESAVTAH